MERWITLGGVAGLSWLLGSCSKTSTSSEESAPEEPVVARSTPAPVIAAPESGPMMVVQPTPAPKRLAPDGTFFLLAKKSVETDAGIVGLSPGTRVTRQEDGKFLAAGNVVELQPHEISNDLDLAARAAGADARAQAAIRQALAARAAASASGNSAAASQAPSTSSPASLSEPSPPSSTAQPAPSLSGSAPLGSAHSMTKDGWLWQKNSEGKWEKVRPLR